MTASSEVKQIHKLKLNTKPIFVPNGIHGGDFASLPNSEIFYHQFPETQNKTLILFLGRIDPKKGLDLLAPAFAQVTQNFSDTHLIIAGPDNTGFLPKAENYFIEAGCRESVTFTGMLTGELKYAALAAAQIYVAPSYSEGFSLSVLEGIASGLPCIITTGCNFPEAKANQAALEVEINTQAIADGLLWCLNHPEEAKQMGEKGRQFIFENYTWDKIAAKLVKAYQSIIDPKERSKFLN
jgi:glycosyltransferase involved in cell wall biosynthesis